jgi:hypothetical protein
MLLKTRPAHEAAYDGVETRAAAMPPNSGSSPAGPFKLPELVERAQAEAAGVFGSAVSEHREPDRAGLPSLADLIFDCQACRRERGMRVAVSAVRFGEKPHQMIDHGLVVTMPHLG